MPSFCRLDRLGWRDRRQQSWNTDAAFPGKSAVDCAGGGTSGPSSRPPHPPPPSLFCVPLEKRLVLPPASSTSESMSTRSADGRDLDSPPSKPSAPSDAVQYQEIYQ